MDFTNCGALEIKGAVQRAHVQWSDNGRNRHIRGPFRLDEEAAKEDLESMRAVTGGPPLQGVLLFYPFGTKEGPGRRFLSDVPFGRSRFPGPKVRQ